MEKKTIGSFIAALRKANGMTQKDLAERLSVSDKTISRWERGDGEPDLAAIPVLAEIFGVSCDELLRGERRAPSVQEEQAQPSQEITVKGEKQAHRLLTLTLARYTTRTVIAVGVSCAGLIAAMICNLGFLRATIGFFISAIFYLAGIICQVLSMNSALLAIAGEDLAYEPVHPFKRRIIYRAEYSIGLAIVFFGVSLPLLLLIRDAYAGLGAGSWILQGFLAGSIALIITAAACYFLNATLIKKGVIALNEKETLVYWHNHRLQRNCILILAGMIMVTCFGHHMATSIWGPYSIMEGTVFHDYETFKAFMEQDVPYEYRMNASSRAEAVKSSAITYYDQYGNEISEEEALKRQLTLTNEDGTPGEIVCEYIERNHSVIGMSYTQRSDTLLPITVRTQDDLDAARAKIGVRNVLFTGLYILEACATLIFYLKNRTKIA